MNLSNIPKLVGGGLRLFGLDPLQTCRAIRGLPTYLKNLCEYCRQSGEKKNDFPFGVPVPCLSDRYEKSGTASGPYFHQDLLAAQRIFENKPVKHIDIGSSVYGFVSHVASFREIEVFDVRDLGDTTDLVNIRFRQHDILDPSFNMSDCCDSLSCLHVLEHFGLGRYGDRVDCNGHLIGLEKMHKMLKPGGKFYLSVPIGPQRVEFDGHRVFSVKYLLGLLAGKFKVDHFSYVDDAGRLFRNVPLEDRRVDENFSCRLGCGIFELTKL